ncbi:MAG: extracellular solute-binding protein [Albimonas sp.]|uniref:extracellular solute-binding protein n=1 Tax=Albimonas sp. TaxID=1872425 RepID=UPI004056316E
MPRTFSRAVLAGALALAAAAASAQEVNLYSSRHYDTDERLYTDFEKATGIKVNRIEAGADELIERMKAEGRNSPADVFLTTDAGRMWRAEEAGILAPVESELLDEKIPEHLRHPDDLWFGFSQRARIIFYDKQDVTEPPQTYAELADPKWKGRVCTRSGSNIYMLSLLAAKIAHDGEEAATEWAQGLWDNRARDPQGGDTDQLRAIVSGECDVVLANTYYFARALRTEVDGVSAHVDRIGWVFPDQDGAGAHVNVSAGAMAAHAPHPEAAKAFLEYLASDSAQAYFSKGNDEYPVVEGVEQAESTAQLGEFKADELNLAELGRNQARAQMIYDSVGYE